MRLMPDAGACGTAEGFCRAEIGMGLGSALGKASDSLLTFARLCDEES